MQVEVGVGVRLRSGSGSMSNNFFKEELNARAGSGRCKIEVGVGNSFLTPD